MNEPSGIVDTLRPPYYAVIFTSLRTAMDEGYSEMAERMVQLASNQPGFLGIESVREGAVGITVSYWASEEAVVLWKDNLEHRDAQASGRSGWYRQYRVRVAKVERDYGFGVGNGAECI